MSDPKDRTNEITELAHSCRQTNDKLKDKPQPNTASKSHTPWTSGALGFGLGVGSAAVAAAFIYANKEKRKK